MSDRLHHRLIDGAALLSRTSAFLAIWAAVAFVAGMVFFLVSSRTVVVASHDAVVEPNLTGQVVVRTGPILPDLRISSGERIGVDIELGKTDATSTAELVKRYAYIASRPEGQIVKIEDALKDMAFTAAWRGALVGLLPIGVWLLIGAGRRRELLVKARGPLGGVAVLVVGGLVVGLWAPWVDGDNVRAEDGTWVPLGDFLGTEIPLPEELGGVQVRADVTTVQTRRLVESAINTYDKSKTFYVKAAEAAADLDVRQPEEGDTVVLFVSDRHDNIGMDAVARAVGDRAGATAAFDAGDDTSSGKTWEAFSLDSVLAEFDGLDSFGVAGNHDHGDFVASYLADGGWTMLDGSVIDGPGGSTLLGIDDPRSSGLGSWRDETGLSFVEVGARLSDVACDSETRVSTILVHDANLAKDALTRGCADLVLGGHLHVQVGPTKVIGENGEIGYSYTTGTTGGAAYAIAVGSKIRREAEISLVTYSEGRPAGIQSVTLQTNGRFNVGPYVPLSYDQPAA